MTNVSPQRGHRGLSARETLGHQANQRAECTVHGFDPTSGPADGTRQLNLGAQAIGGCLQAAGLLDRQYHLLDREQRSSEPGCKTVRQQTEGAMPFSAVPASNTCPGRIDSLVGAMTGQRAPALGMQRALRQACFAPGFLCNVFFAGQPRWKSKLHRPPARPGATGAGQSSLLENGHAARHEESTCR